MTTPTDPQQLTKKVRHCTECAAIAGWLMSELTLKLAEASDRLRTFNNTRGPDRDRR